MDLKFLRDIIVGFGGFCAGHKIASNFLSNKYITIFSGIVGWVLTEKLCKIVDEKHKNHPSINNNLPLTKKIENIKSYEFSLADEYTNITHVDKITNSSSKLKPSSGRIY